MFLYINKTPKRISNWTVCCLVNYATVIRAGWGLHVTMVRSHEDASGNRTKDVTAKKFKLYLNTGIKDVVFLNQTISVKAVFVLGQLSGNSHTHTHIHPVALVNHSFRQVADINNQTIHIHVVQQQQKHH